jgi:hypothetical protein
VRRLDWAAMQAVTIHDAMTRSGVQFLAFDLRDILGLARERVSASTWVCDHVECFGPASSAVHAVSDSESEVEGGKLLELADGIEQTIEGTFSAYLRAGTPWCVIRAIDSSFFVVITEDAGLLGAIRRRFSDVRDSPEDVAYVS